MTETDGSGAPDVAARLLEAAGVPASVARASDGAVEEQALLAELEAVGSAAPSEEEGGTRVVVAGRHFKLGAATWALVTSLAALAISTLDPTGLTRAVALKQALDLVKELRPLLHKLDPAKELVCAAIAGVTAEHRRGGGDHGATKADIERWFHDRGEEAPVALDEVLASLEHDEVLKTTFFPRSGKHYTIRR
jgi:hypothetical protein